MTSAFLQYQATGPTILDRFLSCLRASKDKIESANQTIAKPTQRAAGIGSWNKNNPSRN
jgi:hypothetical protein